MRELLIALVFLLPSLAKAQGANVQTGEHSEFTRVVVTIPRDADWQLGRNDDGYLLRVPGINGYDLGSFFELIPRQRIRDAQIGSDADTLQLFVTCQCYIDAFLEDRSILVLDVRSGPPPRNARYEQPIDAIAVPERQPISPTTYSIPENSLLPVVIPRAINLEIIESPEMAGRSFANIDPISQQVIDTPSVMVADEQTTADLLALEQSIVESLGRALSQGVLVPDLAGETTDGDRNATSFDLSAPGVTLRTGVDLAAVPPTLDMTRTQEGQVCPSEAFFAVSSWGDSRSFSEQLGQLRASIVGEFDRVDEEQLLAKARLFVYFGFGREAIQTLQLDGSVSQERRYLAGVAQIIDDDAVTQGLFEKLVSCQSDVALWAFLAANGTGLDAAVDASTVLRAFKSLPPHLQAHLGARLSEKFLNIDDEDSALQAINMAVAQPEPTAETQLVEATLLQDLGEHEEATDVLMELARSNNRTSVEAMTAFLQDAIQQDFELTSQDFELADALRFENALAPAVKYLELAQMRAYLHQGEFTEAQQLYAELALSADEGDLDSIADELAEAFTAHDDDIQFLEFAFDPPVMEFQQPTALAIAERLLSLGFPERSLELLETSSVPLNNSEGQYLRAEAALLLGDADAALGWLQGLEGERAAALIRAATDVSSGAAFNRSQRSQDEAVLQAWQRNNWSELSADDETLLRDVSATVREEPVSVAIMDSPLLSGRTLLEQSAQSREVLDRLLERFDIAPDP